MDCVAGRKESVRGRATTTPASGRAEPARSGVKVATCVDVRNSDTETDVGPP